MNYILLSTIEEERDFRQLVESTTLHSLLTLVTGMLEAEAAVDTLISIKSKGATRGSLVEREYSTFAVLQQWMVKAWQKLASLNDLSKTTLTNGKGIASLTYSLAEKFCSIEERLNGLVR